MMTLIKDWVWMVTAISPVLIAIGMLYLRSQFPTKTEHTEAIKGVKDEHKQALKSLRDENADGTKGLKESIDHLAAQMDERRSDTDRRLSHLETVTEHLPTRADMIAVERRLGDVERQGAVTNEAVRGIDRIITKMDRTLEMIVQNQIQETRP